MAPIITAINIAAITIRSAVIHCALVKGLAACVTVSVFGLAILKREVSNLIIIGNVFYRYVF